MLIRCIIVDDEPLARSRIRHLIENIEDVHLLRECKNGNQAVEVINKKQPDLIFLDIQMADLDGFSVISKMNPGYTPYVIIISAHDQYALKAFDFEVIDYIQKPFTNQRFNQAINRVRALMISRDSIRFQKKLFHMMGEFKNRNQPHLSSFPIKERGMVKFIDVDDIFCIESYGNYLKLHLTRGYKLYRQTMHFVEKQIEPRQFLRIHRSYIINTFLIDQVKYQSNNEYKFLMKNGMEIHSARTYKTKIEDFIGFDQA